MGDGYKVFEVTIGAGLRYLVVFGMVVQAQGIGVMGKGIVQQYHGGNAERKNADKQKRYGPVQKRMIFEHCRLSDKNTRFATMVARAKPGGWVQRVVCQVVQAGKPRVEVTCAKINTGWRAAREGVLPMDLPGEKNKTAAGRKKIQVVNILIILF